MSETDGVFDLTTEAKRGLLKYLEHEYEYQLFSKRLLKEKHIEIKILFIEYQYIRKLIEQDLKKVIE